MNNVCGQSLSLMENSPPCYNSVMEEVSFLADPAEDFLWSVACPPFTVELLTD